MVLYDMQRFDEAIDFLEEALKYNPDFAEARYNLGNAFAGKGDYEAAREAYSKAQSLNEEYPNAAKALANTLAAKGEYEEAEATYKVALEAEPDSPELIDRLGAVQASRGDYNSAVQTFQQAAEIDPDYGSAQKNLGKILQAAGRIDEAQVVLAQVKMAEERIENIHLRYGNPGGDGTLLVKRHFVLSHRNDWRIPEWVGYRLTADDLREGGSTRRTTAFRPDPELPQGQRAELSDYKGSFFDRGHMASPSDFKRDSVGLSETYLLSNIAPQASNLNRRSWAALEKEVRLLAQTHGQIWVFTGSLMWEDGLESPQNVRRIGAVRVPTHFFKAILCEHSNGEKEMFAFIMPNQGDRLSGETRDYMVSVDRVEELSGLDFFAALPDPQENRLERTRLPSWSLEAAR